MLVNYRSTGVATALIVLMLSSQAIAGGFSRGKADTDILYEPDMFNFRAGVTYVAPQRAYDTINGVSATDGDYTESYAIPSFAAKFTALETISCALTYTQPFGADSKYGTQARLADAASSAIGNWTEAAKFKSEEYGATCSVKFDVGQGKMHFLGGAFVQNFDYEERTRAGTLRLKDDSATGYRLGTAYEIPEYALRAELLYRSEIEHKASGNFTLAPYGAELLALPVGTQLAATGGGKLPQSMEFNLQTGVAPGWLAFGSVRWTDWSVLQTLNYTITGLGPQQKNFRFRDGWTVSAGIGHAFTDTISGLASVTWDRGVGTGADIMTDTWTFGLGASFKHGQGELRLGAALSYLTSGSQRQAPGMADFNATVGGDWAYAGTASYRLKF